VIQKVISADIKDKRSLIFYRDRKFMCVREVYTGCCTINLKSGLAWFITDTLKQKDEESM
jgi:hypothetical protein